MDTNEVRILEELSALIEEQELTKEELVKYLRQMMEIRAFEDNIAELLGQGSPERCFPSVCRPGSGGSWRDWRIARG